MAELRLRGAFTAIVTPFLADGAIDWSAFDRLALRQLEAGIGGLVPCGTTGETPTLSSDEQREVIARTVSLAKGKVPILAGAGSNSTAHAIELAKAAEKAGADAVMVVVPYYNKPSQEGILRHVAAVAAAVGLPVVVYNVPGRSVVDLCVDTTLRLLDVAKNVIGVKDASNNVIFCQDLLRQAGGRVTVMSGDDPLTVPMMSIGAAGVISVTSNVYPAQVQQVTELALVGDFAAASAAHLALFPVHKALFCEPNPQPTKALLSARGLMTAVVRPPLLECTPENQARIVAVCDAYEAARASR